jgi:predicted RNA-binding Zn-ribbon protein involved in translation (DUF1610 family)
MSTIKERGFRRLVEQRSILNAILPEETRQWWFCPNCGSLAPTRDEEFMKIVSCKWCLWTFEVQLTRYHGT